MAVASVLSIVMAAVVGIGGLYLQSLHTELVEVQKTVRELDRKDAVNDEVKGEIERDIEFLRAQQFGVHCLSDGGDYDNNQKVCTKHGRLVDTFQPHFPK